jgi:ABC-2 type transport system permease protein
VSAVAVRARVTQAAVARSEWTKLWSLRSTRWTLLAAFAALAGIGVLASVNDMNHWSSMAAYDRAHYSGAETSIAGWRLADLAVGVLGVLTISGEYATGMIRSSLIAVPRRLPVLWAKVGVFTGVTFIIMLVAALLAFFISQPILSEHHVNQSLGDPGVARVVVGSALFLTALGLFAVGLGALTRNSAGGIATFFGIVLVLPEIVSVLPAGLGNHLVHYLPSEAGVSIATTTPDPSSLSPWTGFAVLCAWAAASVGAAAYLLLRRDA